MSESDNGSVTVNVTSKGQATIPKEIREKLGISTPGKVRFVQTPDGEVVVRPVKPPSEMRGFADASGASDDKPATELLREQRRRDREKIERRGESTE